MVKSSIDNPVNGRRTNVFKLSLEHPNCFYPKDEVEWLSVWDYVKISNGKERFWLTVCKFDLDDNNIVARVDSQLCFKYRYKLWDYVKLKKEHIYQVEKWVLAKNKFTYWLLRIKYFFYAIWKFIYWLFFVGRNSNKKRS